MNLYYIALGLDYETYIENQNDLRYEFQLKTRFISNYFSKEVRKLRYKTDGSFNMISIELNEEKIHPCSIVPINVLKVELPFDKVQYKKIKGTEDARYYIEILKLGLIKASKFKPIPLDSLLDIIEKFEINNYTNEWIHKKKRFKEQDIEIILSCSFNTNNFELRVTINKLSTKKELLSGIVLKTLPDENVFDGMYKDIKLEKDIIITDGSGNNKIIIDKNDALEGRLNFSIGNN